MKPPKFPRSLVERLRARRSPRALWSGLDAVALPLGSLITTAGLMRSLGQQDYGLLVIVLAISGLSTAISPAIAATTTKFVSEAVGAVQLNAQNMVARVVTASLAAIIVIDLLLVIITVLLTTPLSSLIFGSAVVAARPDVGTILTLAVLVVCVQQIDGVFSAGLRGLERFKHQALVEIFMRLATAATVVSVGWITRDIVRVLVTNCAVSALSATLRASVLRRLSPQRRLFALPEAADVSRIFAFGSWMWLNTIATVAYGTVDRIIVGRVLGAAAAGEFNVYIQVSQLVHYAPSSLFAFTFPVVSRLSAGGDTGRKPIVSLYRRHMALIVATALLIATVVTFFHRALFRVLAGPSTHEAHESAYLLLIAGFLLLTVNVAPYYLMLGLGKSKQVSIVSTLSMLAALGLTIVLVPIYGLQGAAIARFGYVFGTLALLGGAQRALARS